MSEYILEMMNITKDFPGVRALDDVNFSVKKGEIHALVGENGAGKSTLMRIISGVYPSGDYQGKMILDGEELAFKSINESEKKGIGIIYQELALVSQLSICENVFLGNEINKNGIISWNKALKETEKVLKEVHFDVNPSTRVWMLSVGQKQLVEIAKVLSREVKLLIFDEPTSAISEDDIKNLFNIILELKSKGVTCIYISHKISEIFRIADTVTVLRDGKTICTHDIKELNEDKVISYMVGRELIDRFPKKDNMPGKAVFEVKDWSVNDSNDPDRQIIEPMSFIAKKGEILGFAGIMGAGRTELAKSIFGAFGIVKSGEIKLHGKKLSIKSPSDAIKAGICYLTEDRKGEGLIHMLDVRENLILASLKDLAKWSGIDRNKTIIISEGMVKSLNIKAHSLEQKVRTLSGGNQQKVIVGKWLMTKPQVLILDEPTRGIDVGAKYEIYKIMLDLARQGVCIIFISSELPEILNMSDRIIVLKNGKLRGEFNAKEADSEKIMTLAAGGR